MQFLGFRVWDLRLRAYFGKGFTGAAQGEYVGVSHLSRSRGHIRM